MESFVDYRKPRHKVHRRKTYNTRRMTKKGKYTSTPTYIPSNKRVAASPKQYTSSMHPKNIKEVSYRWSIFKQKLVTCTPIILKEQIRSLSNLVPQNTTRNPSYPHLLAWHKHSPHPVPPKLISHSPRQKIPVDAPHSSQSPYPHITSDIELRYVRSHLHHICLHIYARRRITHVLQSQFFTFLRYGSYTLVEK